MSFEYQPPQPESLPEEPTQGTTPYGDGLFQNLPPGAYSERACLLNPESGATDDVVVPLLDLPSGTFIEMPDLGPYSDAA